MSEPSEETPLPAMEVSDWVESVSTSFAPKQDMTPEEAMAWFTRPSFRVSKRTRTWMPGSYPVYVANADTVVGWVAKMAKHANDKVSLALQLLPQYRKRIARGELKYAMKRNADAFDAPIETETQHLSNDCPCSQCASFPKTKIVCWRCIRRMYCSQKCRREDREHRDACRLTCHACRRERRGDETFYRCSLCREAYYCSQKCQRADWECRHSFDCSRGNATDETRGEAKVYTFVL